MTFFWLFVDAYVQHAFAVGIILAVFIGLPTLVGLGALWAVDKWGPQHPTNPPEDGGRMMVMMNGFQLTTQVIRDGRLVQRWDHVSNDQHRTLASWVVDTREQQVREALIQLGWTPPKEEPHVAP